MTDSLNYAIGETNRRRAKQEAYNTEHGITPASVTAKINDILDSVFDRADRVDIQIGDDGGNNMVGKSIRDVISELEQKMQNAAANLEFEEAARIRDEIRRLEASELEIGSGPQLAFKRKENDRRRKKYK